MTTDDSVGIDWRIENFNPGHVRAVRAWVRATIAGRSVEERESFGDAPDAEDCALAWVRATVRRMAT